MPSMVWVRTTLKNSCARGNVKPGGLALLECGEDFVLPGGIQLSEGLLMRRMAVGIELSEAAAIKILKVGIGAGEGQINVVEHARVARSRLPWRSGHEAFGKRRHSAGLLVIEEGAMLN